MNGPLGNVTMVFWTNVDVHYFDNEEPTFEVLQKAVMDSKWLGSLKYYVHFW